MMMSKDDVETVNYNGGKGCIHDGKSVRLNFDIWCIPYHYVYGYASDASISNFVTQNGWFKGQFCLIFYV